MEGHFNTPPSLPTPPSLSLSLPPSLSSFFPLFPLPWTERQSNIFSLPLSLPLPLSPLSSFSFADTAVFQLLHTLTIIYHYVMYTTLYTIKLFIINYFCCFFACFPEIIIDYSDVVLLDHEKVKKIINCTNCIYMCKCCCHGDV